jgi:hypothetical protein
MCSCGEAEQDTSHILQAIQEPSGIGIRDMAIEWSKKKAKRPTMDNKTQTTKD